MLAFPVGSVDGSGWWEFSDFSRKSPRAGRRNHPPARLESFPRRPLVQIPCQKTAGLEDQKNPKILPRCEQPDEVNSIRCPRKRQVVRRAGIQLPAQQAPVRSMGLAALTVETTLRERCFPRHQIMGRHPPPRAGRAPQETRRLLTARKKNCPAHKKTARQAWRKVGAETRPSSTRKW